jgi:hypothetical protein
MYAYYDTHVPADICKHLLLLQHETFSWLRTLCRRAKQSEYAESCCRARRMRPVMQHFN